MTDHTCVKKSQWRRSLRWSLGILILSTPVGSGEVQLDLKGCIQRSLTVNPSIQAAETDIRIAEAQLGEARAARFLPKLDISWIVGPSPEARGDALTGDSNWRNLRAFTRTEVSFVQPLTFGKLSAAADAASGGLLAHEAGLEKARHDLEYRVTEGYYLLLLANQLRSLAEEAKREITNARGSIDESLEEDAGVYTYTDLHRVDRFIYDVEENYNKVLKGQALARSGMHRLLGLDDLDSLVLADDRLRPVRIEIESLEKYLERVPARPDLRQLKAGVGIRMAQVRVAKSDLYPQLFLAGGFKYSYAPNRDDQKNPFLKDEFNFTQLGAVVGFRQSLSFGLSSARLKKARLERRKIEYQERLAHLGAEMQTEQIYRTVKEMEANVAASRKAIKATRRWFISARDGFNAGLEEAGELIDAVKEYGIIRAKHYQAIFEFNRAWMGLQRATGRSIVE